MGAYPAAGLQLLTGIQLLLGWALVRGQSGNLNPADACSDYVAGPRHGSVWTLEDCVEVWSQFQTSVSDPFRTRVPDIDTWGSTGLQLREAGSPCMVKATFDPDGAGSTTMRNLATWIFAEELGCDWATPTWTGKSSSNLNGTTLYCHWTTPLAEATVARQDMVKNGAALKASNRCSIIDWLSYFQFNVPSVPWPETGTLKVIEPDRRSFRKDILDIQSALREKGVSRQHWDRLVFSLPNSLASQTLINLGSWDKTKRHVTRKVLQEARTNFHRHPRQWYDENPQCGYSEGRLHFAVHIRMGDRRTLYDGSLKYYELLERLMDNISGAVIEMGLEPPLFHLFSETVKRCPSGETGLFDEFPLWPVKLDQVCNPNQFAQRVPERYFSAKLRLGRVGKAGKSAGYGTKVVHFVDTPPPALHFVLHHHKVPYAE